jgi:hypothetical protein
MYFITGVKTQPGTTSNQVSIIRTGHRREQTPKEKKKKKRKKKKEMET